MLLPLKAAFRLPHKPAVGGGIKMYSTNTGSKNPLFNACPSRYEEAHDAARNENPFPFYDPWLGSNRNSVRRCGQKRQVQLHNRHEPMQLGRAVAGGNERPDQSSSG